MGEIRWVGSESELEEWQRVQISEVQEERVPELGGRATEGPAPHSAEVGRGNSEVNGERGSEGVGRSDDVEKVRQIRRGEVMNGSEPIQEEFELYSLFDRKPMEVLQDVGDVVVWGLLVVIRAAEFWSS